MILCDGNYRLGAYGMDLVHNWNPSEAGYPSSITYNKL